MARNIIAIIITIVIVACLFWNFDKSNDNKQFNVQRISSTVQNVSSRDKYGLLASDYDKNGWAKVNGRWVSNPREGALVKYSERQQDNLNTTDVRTVSHTTNGQISQYANIERTLRLVAENWKNIDVNGDRKYNCIDAAVLFYRYYPDKSKVCIMLNQNNKTGFNHLFNCVFTDGEWKAIEPQSYAKEYSKYFMWELWGNKYDNSYNRDVTSDYLRYVRN